MELNKLSYQIINQSEQTIKDGYFVNNDEDFPGTLFELLIDDQTISNWLKTEDKAIPYFYFTENEEIDLPACVYGNELIYILAVCSCGDAGCGSFTMKMTKEENYVNLTAIDYGFGTDRREPNFCFVRENYDLVIKEIKEKAREFEKNLKKQD